MNQSNSMPIKYNKGESKLVCALLMVWSIFVMTPALAKLGTEVSIIMLLIWSILLVKKIRLIKETDWSTILLLTSFLFIIVSYKVLGISTSEWSNLGGYLEWILACIIGTSIRYILDLKYQKKLGWFIYFLTLFNMIYVIYQGKLTEKLFGPILASDVANAAFSSDIMLFSGICIVGMMVSASKKYKVAYLLGIILATYVNFAILSRATNVILTVAMLVLMYLYTNKNKGMRSIIIGFSAFCIIIVWISGMHKDILRWLIEVIPSDRLVRRFNALLAFLETGNVASAGSSLAARWELLNNSISSFFSSPITVLLGVGDHREVNEIIGNHNELIDVLARHGLVGASILYCSIYKQCKRVIKNIRMQESQYLALYKIIFWVFILRNILGNALTAATAIHLFIYMQTMEIRKR